MIIKKKWTFQKNVLMWHWVDGAEGLTEGYPNNMDNNLAYFAFHTQLIHTKLLKTYLDAPVNCYFSFLEIILLANIVS